LGLNWFLFRSVIVEMISWPAALRLYAKETGHYILPKKGSAAYDAVKKLQMETEHSPEHEIAKRGNGKKAKASKVRLEKAHHSEIKFGVEGGKGEPAPSATIVSGKISKKKAPTARGGASEVTTTAGDAVLPPASKLTQIDNQGIAEKSKKVVEPEAHPEKKPGRKGIGRSGKTVAAEITSDIVNRNTGMSAAVSAQLAGQTEEIKGALKTAKKTPKVVLVGDGGEATIDGLKSDDPKAIEGKAPFSIQALRNKLLC
jgi:hypothetical protein